MKLFSSIRFKIAITIFIIIMLFSASLIIIIRNSVAKNIQDDICENVYVKQEKLDESFTQILDTINLLFSPIIANSTLYEITSDSISLQDKELLYYTMMSKMPIDESVFGDVLMYYKGDFLHSKLQNEDEYLPYEDNIFAHLVTNHQQVFYQGELVKGLNDELYVLFGKPFPPYSFPEQDGCLIFAIKYNAFYQRITEITTNGSYNFIVSNESKILFHPNNQFVNSVIFESNAFDFSTTRHYQIQEVNANRSLVVISPCSKVLSQYNFSWHIVSVISYDVIFGELNQLNTYIIIVSIISTILALILAYFISAGLTGPILKLNNRMVEYSDTGLHKQEISTKQDEIAELEATFDKMINTITKLIEENNQEQEEKRKLELDALQMQINPHFLYNTLDAIVWIARLKKQDEIERLVMALAQFFRISLHKGDKYITVEEEIELIQNFIEIELIRFPDKFTIEYIIDDDVKKCETMKLILQPIVENAIKHGISTLTNKGHIIIKAYQDESYIYYEVIDDGIGFIPNNDLLKPHKQTTSGYGLYNVNERIKLEYGDECGITIYSKPNEGTKIIVKFIKKDN